MPTIALGGNPNCGKSALFNALTGIRQRTGNWPGVTVDRKEGHFKLDGEDIRVIDLPGIYSLDATSLDEQITRDYLLSRDANLIVNAHQAMPNGGALRIRSAVEAGMLVVEVSDTGCGIPPENIAKLFEPLFTTKMRGIGLGLAVSKNLAEANGGRITVASRVGQGSAFTLHLPLCEPTPEEKG